MYVSLSVRDRVIVFRKFIDDRTIIDDCKYIFRAMIGADNVANENKSKSEVIHFMILALRSLSHSRAVNNCYSR